MSRYKVKRTHTPEARASMSASRLAYWADPSRSGAQRAAVREAQERRWEREREAQRQAELEARRVAGCGVCALYPDRVHTEWHDCYQVPVPDPRTATADFIAAAAMGRRLI